MVARSSSREGTANTSDVALTYLKCSNDGTFQPEKYNHARITPIREQERMWLV